MAGAYNGDARVKAGSQHGLDFSLRGPLFAIGEVGFRWNYGDHATGLARNIKAGVYFNGGRFEVPGVPFTAAQIRTAHGLYGVYILGDQVLARWGDASQHRHLGLFGAFLSAPQERLHSAPGSLTLAAPIGAAPVRESYFFDTGLVAYGLAARRPKDFAAVGIAYGSYATRPQAILQTFETTIEWTYGCVIRPGLVVQPSLQYIVHPKGTAAIPNALAAGVNLVINF
jgi:carbohydrate-selective porin OprB